uniref:Ig-like domain-containing protein n=1 Tax=Xiphophorus couchianus TaxID=32473 RepID=A0A3B5LBF3_9TELE
TASFPLCWIFCNLMRHLTSAGLTDGSDVTQTPLLWANQSQSATINCSQNKDVDHNQMYWYQQLPGQNMKQIVFTRAGSSLSSLVIPKLRQSEDSAVYFCAASDAQYSYFGAGTKLTVLGKEPQIILVKILPPSPRECRDQKKEKGERRKTLVCLASGFYPDHVSVFWQLNGQNVTDGVATDAAAKKDKTTKTYSITSRLRLQAKTWFNPGNEFSCHVTFFNGTNYKIYTAPIYKKYLRITQNAKLSYSALIVKSCLYAALVCFLVWRLQVGPAESAALSKLPGCYLKLAVPGVSLKLVRPG